MIVHPNNGYRIKTGWAWLWVLLFAPLYYLYKGMWGMAIITFILGMVTYGFSNILFALFAKKSVEDYYLKKGFIRVN